MATFVLVHGGRHGGWCWRRPADLLQSAGHRVVTPTLTGMGERSHLLSPNITLQTHIDDIVNVIEWESLHDVVLVGHSYGGMVISGAAEIVESRIANLVYLDAIVPRDGESIIDLATPPKAAMLLETINGPGEGWCLPPIRSAREYGVEDPDDVVWVDSKMSAQPARTYLDRVGSVTAAWRLPGAFIECVRHVQYPVPRSIERARQRAQDDPSFRYVRLDSHHDAMVTAPNELVEVLLEIARGVTCTIGAPG